MATFFQLIKRPYSIAAGIAQLVRQLATALEVRRTNPGAVEIFARAHTGPEAQPALCTTGTGYLLRLKRQKRCADHSTPCSGGIRMGWSYTSASPLCTSWGDLNLYYSVFIET